MTIVNYLGSVAMCLIIYTGSVAESESTPPGQHYLVTDGISSELLWRIGQSSLPFIQYETTITFAALQNLLYL